MSNSVVGILSLIFGILGFFTAHWYFGVLFIIVAIILGVVALTDYLSYKWSAITGLVFSGLGMVLLIWTFISDINSNKLIICYNSGDKIYLSNYKQISEVMDELSNFDAGTGVWSEEKNVNERNDSDDERELAVRTENIDVDVQTEPTEIIEEIVDNTSESAAIQPDRDWYMGRASTDSDDAEEREYMAPETADRVLYQDENVIITYDGISEGSWGGGYDINLTVENLSQRTLTVQCREMSINGYMVEPICSIDVASGKKSRDEISIMGEDAEFIPMNMVNNVETKFHIFDFNDMIDFTYDTENIVIR